MSLRMKSSTMQTTTTSAVHKGTDVNSQRGVTLIETLIAVVILAIGVLGIASLLTLSKVSQHEAVQRVRAVALGNEMLERIRRNPSGAAAYHTGFNAPIGGPGGGEAPADCTMGAACSAAQLAARDQWLWEQRVNGALVTVTEEGETRNTAGLRGLRGCVDFAADAGKVNTGIVSVVLQWQGMNESTDAVAAGGSVCGGEEAGSDDTRRQVVVSTYVVDEMEL